MQSELYIGEKMIKLSEKYGLKTTFKIEPLTSNMRKGKSVESGRSTI